MKKYWWQICSIFTLICLLCLSVGVTALADTEEGTLMVVKAEVDSEQVTLTLTLPENSGVAAGKVGFNYDADKLELVSASYDGFAGAFVVVNSKNAGRIVVSLASLQEITSGGYLTAVFNLKEHTYDNSYIEFTEYQLGNASGEKLEELSTVETVPVAVECTHSWGEWTVTKEATCTEAGTRVRTCSICGETETETVAALGHDDSGEWTVVKAATCTETGIRELYCLRCGELLKTEEIPMTPHNFGDWTIVTGATCTEDGERVRECKDCGKRETEVIPALGHTEGEWIVVKEATENEEGLKELYCTVCGELLKSETIPVIATEPEETTKAEEETSKEEETTAEAEETTAIDGSNNESENTGDTGYVYIALLLLVAAGGFAAVSVKKSEQ